MEIKHLGEHAVLRQRPLSREPRDALIYDHFRARFKHALAMGALCTAVIGAWAYPAAADGAEPLTQPNDLPPIRWIVVERNGQKAVATPARVDCSRFVMTQRTAARHLKASLRIFKWVYDHTIDWLPCLAEGRVGFTDGRLAYWSIAEGGGSSVRFDDGQEVHLYYANCRLPRTGSWRHGGLP